MNIIVSSIIIGISIIISIWIFVGYKHFTEIKKKKLDLACKHTWKTIDSQPRVRTISDGYGSETRKEYVVHTLQCTKCGEIEKRTI